MSKQITTAIILIYCSVFIASSIYVMIPLQPILAETFDVSLSYMSLSSTLFVFPYAFGLLLFGVLADRLPLRNILLVGMALLAIVTGLLSLTNSIDSLIFLRVFQGILAASFAPVSFAYCFKHFKGSLQAFVIAMINTGFLFAGVFGQIISAFFADLFSYQAVFIAFFCFYLSCFIGLFLTLESSSSKQTYRLNNLFSTILSCFKHQSLQKLYAITFFLLLTIMLFYGSFEIFLFTEWRDFPFSLQLFRTISLIGIIPAFFASPLIKRFGSENILMFQLGVMVVGFIPIVICLNVATALFASLLMIASTSLTIPMVVLLVGKHASSHKSTAVAVYSFTLLIGASLGSTLASYLSFTTVITIIPIAFIGLCLFSGLMIHSNQK
ncbi:MFS transporter [Aquibacillus saliphilus]|uniref:MFS transporter n=1 Tax=Aquibacillus saliphilus TaxID=1909422 RepID=UPI001CF0531C|nr:MFS transporter [Aquibacillus saliphilus]